MFGPRDVAVDVRTDGSYVLRSPHRLGAYARCMTDRLLHWAVCRPDAVFLAERDGDDWRTLTYRNALRDVRSMAQGLLERGCSRDRGLAILSGNSIDHATLALAAQYAGVPYAPISPAYSLRSSDLAKLRHVFSIFDPAIVYIDDVSAFTNVLTSDLIGAGVPIVATRALNETRACESLEALRGRTPSDAVDAANDAVSATTVAKILFTSGSTGLPKAVINTQRMLCSNQQMNLQALPFIADGELTMIDWSPWNHTAGSNLVFNMVLANGGTLYIDDGKPTATQFATSIRNLREVSPTIYFSVPRGYEFLTDVLENDRQLCRTFFRKLELMWYGGAALSTSVRERLARLTVRERGSEILLTGGFGSTETAPSVTLANWRASTAGNIGLPLPGIELKLVPAGAKLEVRLRGPNVTPGYLKRDDLTREAFDEEGYFRMGDALKPVDPNDFRAGLLFDGRIGEDFKLTSGTWVSVAPLRDALLAVLRPVVRDLVICGEEQSHPSLLLIPDVAAARALAGATDDAEGSGVLAHPIVRRFVREALEAVADAHPGSSQHATRAIFLDRPPSVESGEITDKGSLNAAIIRTQRAPLVGKLYRSAEHASVIAIPERT